MHLLRFVALLAIPAQIAFGQQNPTSRGGSLTLDDAIATARQNNPQLAQTRNMIRQADATVRTTYGALLPSASASVRSSYTQGGTQYYNGIALGANGPATYNSNYFLGLNYSVAAGALYAPRAAVANRAASEATVTSATETLRSNVTTQYIQTLEQQATAALNDTLVTTAKGQLDLANAKMEVGAGTILDVRTAEVALGQAQVAALQAHNQARIENLRLFQLMGVPEDPDAHLTTQFAIVQPASVDSLIRLAHRVNPDLAAKKSTQYADEMQVKVARSSYMPSLNISTGFGATAAGYQSIDPLVTQAQAQVAGSYGSCLSSDSLRRGAGLAPRGCTAGLSPTAVEALRQQYQSSNKPFSFNSTPLSLSAGLSLPIFNNFQRESNIEQARVARDNANYDLKARETQVTADVTSAYLNLVTAQRTVELRTTTARQATEALAFAEESYKVGSKTFLDVTTAQGTYQQALINRVNSVYEYHKAFAALENAVGRPLR